MKPESEHTYYDREMNFNKEDEKLYTDQMTKEPGSPERNDSVDQILMDSECTRNAELDIKPARSAGKGGRPARLRTRYSIDPGQVRYAEPKTAQNINRDKLIVIPSHLKSCGQNDADPVFGS